ncbi:unnamed protein product [Triticum turgidum subsp. durum]|uniref:Translation elongation factor EF1B beta/delta subunit guanine nucleotide exchange domain-containing protein n=1 Tax=Triticum turgidum subsp. durum TaxID=4567 RepID=A0A9R1NKY6_TRITD|nr:unnamed protein product [Triticum turgidum subsp. durum]
MAFTQNARTTPRFSSPGDSDTTRGISALHRLGSLGDRPRIACSWGSDRSDPSSSQLNLGVSSASPPPPPPSEFDKPPSSPDPMAVTFSDLHTADGLKALEAHLAGKTYISGDGITKDDVKVFAAVPVKPSAEFPNAARWYDTVAAAVASRFPGQSSGDEDDDDDMDLFGDETEEDKKAAAEREAAKPAKKKESGKSSVLMDIKPWDDETDMKKLEEAVRSVQMEGLTWGASKLMPVGYGIKKLQIMLTIIDDLVSVDTLIEEVLCETPINEYVQSCDIVAFNKI